MLSLCTLYFYTDNNINLVAIQTFGVGAKLVPVSVGL